MRNLNRIASSLLLACSAMLATSEAVAQARAPAIGESRGAAKQVTESPAARARRIAELEAWLRRLHGEFRVRITSGQGGGSTCGLILPDGSCGLTWYFDGQTFPDYSGSAECRAIGAGPGVSCRFQMTPLPDVLSVRNAPLEILFGMDPDEPAIRMMWVGGGASVWEASGLLENNTVHLRCISPSCSRLWTIFSSGGKSIFARRDGERIDLNLPTVVEPPPIQSPYIATVVELRRVNSKADGAPTAAQ